MSYKLGDVVSWSSSSNGRVRVKQGTVVGVVPANAHPVQQISALVASHGAASTYGGGHGRTHESYLVLSRGRTPQSKPRLYWPRTSALLRGCGEQSEAPDEA